MAKTTKLALIFEISMPTIAYSQLQENPFPKEINLNVWQNIQRNFQVYYALPTKIPALAYYYPNTNEMGISWERHDMVFDKKGNLSQSSIPKTGFKEYVPAFQKQELKKGKPAVYIYYDSQGYDDGLRHEEWSFTFQRYGLSSADWGSEFSESSDIKAQESFLGYMHTLYTFKGQKADIFKYNYKHSKGEENYYAVYVHGLLYFFDLKGNFSHLEKIK